MVTLLGAGPTLFASARRRRCTSYRSATAPLRVGRKSATTRSIKQTPTRSRCVCSARLASVQCAAGVFAFRVCCCGIVSTFHCQLSCLFLSATRTPKTHVRVCVCACVRTMDATLGCWCERRGSHAARFVGCAISSLLHD